MRARETRPILSFKFREEDCITQIELCKGYMEQIVQQILNGLTIGSIYALIALGYTMIYGIMKLINFAHGEVFMLGAYMSYVGMVKLNMPFFAALIFSMVVSGFVGFLIERIAYRPLRDSSRVSALITAIGVSILMQNLIIRYFGADIIALPKVELLRSFTIGGIVISGNQIVIFSITIFLLIVLQYIVYKTDFGRAMRAVSTDAEAASLMGIDVNKTITITFVLGSVLAAAAGTLVANYYSNITPLMGVARGLKAFIAAVFGGIGLLNGAVLGSFVIGGIETVIAMTKFTMWREAAVYFVLIIILIVKPTGLLGKKGGQKV